MKKRVGILLIFAILFTAFLANWTYSYYQGLEEAYIPINEVEKGPVIPSEIKVFERSDKALDYARIPIDEQHRRTIATYYDNRAYPGAPPSIPHPVSEKMGIGGNNCLQCHENGGFVEKFNAYAPVTPHPEMINCKQCHIEQQVQRTFVATDFYKKPAPEIGVNNALPGSPPVIPHQLQMRENCLACHAGPSAVKEIWVSHPERVNCRQCHVPKLHEIQNVKLFLRTNNGSR
ncbi:nitrate reductase cytochrome c-type subunit [Ulvibacterium sp.]|uniref:nitrate reductase cytochrome c-type subunit n=1 Tax=Ulvibacterium sp. TaxID=2665914 RepID=UPI002622922F|nr:nitrate reductase cytochrome c-type subunit [Ulvibacterium sp.]